MSTEREDRPVDLCARLHSWLERQYGHAAAAAGELVSSEDLPHFTWKRLPSHEPLLPKAVGIRELGGQPICYELVESHHTGRNRHTYWTFDRRLGWRLILDV